MKTLIEVKKEYRASLVKKIGRRRYWCIVMDFPGCINSGATVKVAAIKSTLGGKVHTNYMVKAEAKFKDGPKPERIFRDDFGFPAYYWFPKTKAEAISKALSVAKPILKAHVDL